MQYLTWRTLVGLHQKITISFLIVGHTKFAPDWCFGLLKQRFRKTYVSSLEDLVEVVNSSAAVNTAQLVGTQDGEVIVPCYDWSSFLGKYMNKVPKMKSYHHFTFSSASPGIVTLKQYSDSVSTTFSILKDSEWVPSAEDLPPTIPPSGLSNNRQWYLYRQIREFCREGTEDETCPKPALPPPEELPQVEQAEEEALETVPASQAPKRPCPRRCGKCGETGHTRRTCTS